MYRVEYLDPSQDTNWIRFSAFIHHRIPFDLSSSAVHQTPDRAVVLCLDIAPHLYSVVGRSVVASTRVIIITVLEEPCPIPSARDKRWPPEHRFIVCLLSLVFGSLEYSVSPRLLLCWPAVQQQSHQITDTLLVRLPRLLLRLLTPLRVHFFYLQTIYQPIHRDYSCRGLVYIYMRFLSSFISPLLQVPTTTTPPLLLHCI